MNRTDHLLVCLLEELAEATQATTKAIRFGLGDYHPDGFANNAEQITLELNDVIAVAEMLQADGKLAHIVDVTLRKEKRLKVEKYMEGRVDG